MIVKQMSIELWIVILQPYDHGKSVATFYYADKSLIEKAIDVALESKASWESTPAEDRLEIHSDILYNCSLKSFCGKLGEPSTVHVIITLTYKHFVIIGICVFSKCK